MVPIGSATAGRLRSLTPIVQHSADSLLTAPRTTADRLGAPKCPLPAVERLVRLLLPAVAKERADLMSLLAKPAPAGPSTRKVLNELNRAGSPHALRRAETTSRGRPAIGGATD
jgi:hypothetical protein